MVIFTWFSHQWALYLFFIGMKRNKTSPPCMLVIVLKITNSSMSHSTFPWTLPRHLMKDLLAMASHGIHKYGKHTKIGSKNSDLFKKSIYHIFIHKILLFRKGFSPAFKAGVKIFPWICNNYGFIWTEIWLPNLLCGETLIK